MFAFIVSQHCLLSEQNKLDLTLWFHLGMIILTVQHGTRIDKTFIIKLGETGTLSRSNQTSYCLWQSNGNDTSCILSYTQKRISSSGVRCNLYEYCWRNECIIFLAVSLFAASVSCSSRNFCNVCLWYPMVVFQLDVCHKGWSKSAGSCWETCHMSYRDT